MSESVAIELYDDTPLKGFDSLLSCFPSARKVPDIVFKILPQDGSTFSLEDHLGNSRYCGSWFEAYYTLECGFYETVLHLEKFYFVFHSAAVQHRPTRKVVWLMGLSMCGKSSLTLALLRSGRFAYAAEDAVGLHPETFETITYPRPIRIRNGMETLISRCGGWETIRGPSKSLVYVKPPRARLIRDRKISSPSLIIFPQFCAGAPSQFSAIKRAELLASLVTFCVNDISFLNKARLADLAGFAAHLPAMRLVWSDPLDAAETVLGMVE